MNDNAKYRQDMPNAEMVPSEDPPSSGIVRGATSRPRGPLAGEWLPASSSWPAAASAAAAAGAGEHHADRAPFAADRHAENAVSEEVREGRQLALTDPASLFRHGRLRALQALAPNTVRAYRADWSTFVRFCARHGAVALPATCSTLEAFIEWRSPWNRELAAHGKYLYFAAEHPRDPVSASAIERALTAIGAVHQALRLTDATADSEVRATLKIHCEWRRTQRQKKPLRWEQVQAALIIMGAQKADLRTARNQAMLALAYSTLLRRAELVAVELEHYERDRDSATARLRVVKTKAGVEQHGRFRHVRAEAVQLVEAWIARSGITGGPLFRGIDPAGRLSPRAMHAGEVARIFKHAAALIGEPAAGIGGHSTRIGALKDLARFGAELPELMVEGGWRSPQMPAVYLREHDADTGAMARMAQAQRRADKES